MLSRYSTHIKKIKNSPKTEEQNTITEVLEENVNLIPREVLEKGGEQ